MAIEQLKGKPWYVGLAAGAALVGAIFFVVWLQVVSKQRDEIVREQARLEQLQAKIQEGRAAQRELPKFREEVRRLELELDRLRPILPAQRNTWDLLRGFRTLAEQGDLGLQRIRTGSEAQREFYSEWPINMEMTGTFHTMALFFDRISRIRRIINIEDLRVTSQDPRANRGHTIQASFVARTFVYLETEDAPAAGGGR
jgi:type IV pilus assembly protein PilO